METNTYRVSTARSATGSSPLVKDLGEHDQPGDMSRMSYGGFAPLVTA
jgi:uncharacterized protein YbaA (DUF1428 family)